MKHPIICEWDGDALKPIQRFHSIVNDQLVVGEKYRIEFIQERSRKSHNHFYAVLKELWLNLPEHVSGRFATPEHMRKWALIQTGWHKREEHAASSEAEALKLVAFMKPVDEYAVIFAKGNVVVRMIAKSQSLKAMGKSDFQRSKTDVLDCVSSLIIGSGIIPDRSRQCQSVLRIGSYIPRTGK
jgi:hypothetical protein